MFTITRCDGLQAEILRLREENDRMALILEHQEEVMMTMTTMTMMMMIMTMMKMAMMTMMKEKMIRWCSRDKSFLRNGWMPVIDQN